MDSRKEGEERRERRAGEETTRRGGRGRTAVSAVCAVAAAQTAAPLLTELSIRTHTVTYSCTSSQMGLR